MALIKYGTGNYGSDGNSFLIAFRIDTQRMVYAGRHRGQITCPFIRVQEFTSWQELYTKIVDNSAIFDPEQIISLIRRIMRYQVKVPRVFMENLVRYLADTLGRDTSEVVEYIKKVKDEIYDAEDS